MTAQETIERLSDDFIRDLADTCYQAYDEARGSDEAYGGKFRELLSAEFKRIEMEEQ